jgi:hypothetical protein
VDTGAVQIVAHPRVRRQLLICAPQETGKLADVARRAGGFFRPTAMPEIAVALPFRCAAASAMHPADAIAAYCRRTTTLPSSFRFGIAPRGFVSPLHGVVAHLLFSTPPTSKRSGCLVSLRIGIGFSELTARRAGDATLRVAPTPVVTLSVMIA